MKLAREALKRHQPDVFCDTTGCAFTFVIARWMLPRSSWILAYVHYPTISTDMMQFEWQHSGRSKFKTVIKLIYFWCFAILYGLVGSLADLVMVNSTWTYGHITGLWRLCRDIRIVYPPCRVQNEEESPSQNRKPIIVSIGQFRPEKNHKLQLEALSKVLQRYPEYRNGKVVLKMIGSCRNPEDEQRVDELRGLVKQWSISDAVEFSLNPPYSAVLDSMKEASIGIHTMRQEHFGIGIVEMMAAGLVTIAHNSGGPQTDIIHPGATGFLATSADEYAEAIHQVLIMSDKDAQNMRRQAQTSALRFSDAVFDESLRDSLQIFS